MIDVFKFLINCIMGFLGVLDEIILFNSFSLLKLLISLLLFTTIVSFLFKRRGK